MHISLKGCTASLIRGHHGLFTDFHPQEYVVFAGVRIPDECVRGEARHARGDVKFGRWSLVGRARWIAAEALGDVTRRGVLVEERERDARLKRPGKKCVELALHHNEEERHVRPVADAVAVHVQSSAQLVTARTGVERRRVDCRALVGFRLMHAPSEVADLPDENAVLTSQIEHVDLGANAGQFDVVDCK